MSLDQSIVLTHVSIVVCRDPLSPQASTTDVVRARQLFELFQSVPDTTYNYIMVAQEVDTADLKEDIRKKPGLNNLEEATRFVQEVDKAVQKFADTVHQYKLYSIQNAYLDFIKKYDIEDYYKDASITTVLELIDDTTCKIL